MPLDNMFMTKIGKLMIIKFKTMSTLRHLSLYSISPSTLVFQNLKESNVLLFALKRYTQNFLEQCSISDRKYFLPPQYYHLDMSHRSACTYSKGFEAM